MKRLPDTELEVMKALWASGPDTPRAVLEQNLESFGWAANTINTYLTRLAGKGFLSVRREGRGNLYTPLIAQEDYQAFDSRSVLSRLYGSPRNFVAALARDGLERQDLEDLRALLDELEEGRAVADLLPVLGGLTLSGSALICLLALTARAGRPHIGARWRCLAWLLLCLRLAVPVPLFSDTQIGREQPLVQLPAPSDTVIYQYRPAPGPQLPIGPEQTGTGQPWGSPGTDLPPVDHSAPAAPVQPTETAPGFTLSLSQALTLGWLGGGVLFLLWTLAAHLRFLAYLRRWAGPVEQPHAVALFNQLGDRLGLDRRPALLTCPGLPAPMLAGLFRPVLLLPREELERQTLCYSLLHELTHFRRRDIWLKTLALWVNAVHWFNPLVWYMVRLIERDTELACDEDALGRLPSAEHAAYGRTILDAAERVKG